MPPTTILLVFSLSLWVWYPKMKKKFCVPPTTVLHVFSLFVCECITVGRRRRSSCVSHTVLPVFTLYEEEEAFGKKHHSQCFRFQFHDSFNLDFITFYHFLFRFHILTLIFIWVQFCFLDFISLHHCKITMCVSH